MTKMKQVTENDFFKDFDFVPSREYLLEQIRLIIKKIGSFYGFQKISTSVVEEYKRYSPLVKEGFLDVFSPVQVKTKNGTEILLRPSGVLGALRVYGDYGMINVPQPVKLMFEGESFAALPDGGIAGQYEAGLLVVGEDGPIAEAELFQVIWKTLEEFGVRQEGVSLRLNAVGCSLCSGTFRSALGSYYRSRVNRLCKACKRDVKRFPTKLLACREEKCKTAASHAPQVLDYLCEVCKKHLRSTLEFLDEMKVPYFLDHLFFREGGFYSNVIFEFAYTPSSQGGSVDPAVAGVSTNEKPALNSGAKEDPFVIVEGGRVPRVAELIIERKISAVVALFHLGETEKMLVVRHSLLGDAPPPKVFLVQLGELAKRKSIMLIEMLRAAGIDIAEILGKDSIKSQLNSAEKSGVRFALILGQKEALDEMVIVREIDSGVQETIPQEKLIEFLRKKLG